MNAVQARFLEVRNVELRNPSLRCFCASRFLATGVVPHLIARHLHQGAVGKVIQRLDGKQLPAQVADRYPGAAVCAAVDGSTRTPKQHAAQHCECVPSWSPHMPFVTIYSKAWLY